MPKLLFITSAPIGDAVLSTGVLSTVLGLSPGVRVTVACGPGPAGLFAGVPGLERLIVFKKQPRAGHWRQLWRETVGTRWDLVIDMRGSAIAHLLPAERRLVFRASREPMHKVRQCAGVLGLSGNPPAPRLWATPTSAARAWEAIPDGPPVLALSPAASWRGKEWPLERFAALVQRLTGPGGILPGARVAVFCAPEERQTVQPLLQAIPAVQLLDVAGNLDLLAIYSSLRRCALFVGNDSGLMHLAAVAGLPVLGLFGPTDDRLYAPWGDHCAVVRTPETPAQLTSAPDYDPRTTGTLMGTLSVDAVVEAATGLYRRMHGAPVAVG